MTRVSLLLALLMGAPAAGCAVTVSSSSTTPSQGSLVEQPPPLPERPSLSIASGPVGHRGFYVEEGTSYYYGGTFHGRKTANGERFNMHAMTCAHRTLPLGSRVRVTNLRNGRQLVLRVNDRGPWGKRKKVGPNGEPIGSYRGQLDVSKGAAQRLGFIGAGSAPVRIELLGG